MFDEPCVEPPKKVFSVPIANPVPLPSKPL
jgi:hypothetical protein